MSTRCKACDVEMDTLTTTNIEGTTVMEDLCSGCKDLAASEWSYIYDHRHILEDAEEGPTEMINTEEY